MIKTKNLILPILIALVILPRLSMDLYLPSLPYLGSYLQASDQLLQMTLTVFMFGYALSMLITGPLSDAWGRRNVLICGLSLYLIASLICASANSIFVLIIARFFQALGGCCGTVVARVMVKDGFAREQQIKMLAHLSAAMAICPIFIPIIGGTLQIYFGWRMVFYLLALFSFILLVTCVKQINPPEVNSESISLKILFRRYKSLLMNRVFLGYSFAIGFAWCDYFSFTLESPFLLQKILNFNSIMFGILFSIPILGYLIGTQLTKLFANKIGWDRLIFLATIICLIGALILSALVFLLPIHWMIIVFPMVIIMIGVGIIIPCSQGAVMQPFPKMAGTVSGLFFFIQMLFGGICGLILQMFNHQTAHPLAIASVISSLMLVISFYKLIYSKVK